MAGGTLVGIFTSLDGRPGTAHRYLRRFQRSLLRWLFHLSSRQKSSHSCALPGEPELSSPGIVLGPSRQRRPLSLHWVRVTGHGGADNPHVFPGNNDIDTPSKIERQAQKLRTNGTPGKAGTGKNL